MHYNGYMKQPNKNSAWFIKKRGSYLPANRRGLAMYLTYLAYIVALPVAWFMHGHDLWTLVVVVVPLWVVAAVLVQYIASKHA